MLRVSADPLPGTFRDQASIGKMRVMRFWISVLFIAISFSSAAFPRNKEKDRANYDGAGTFSIEIDQPYQKVSEVVRDAATSGVIHGTYEYHGEDSLPKADAQKSCKLFARWDADGEVFFKVRTRALAPAHFLNSNDMGTVAVRYVVQELSLKSTRLYIDAVFVADSHHGKHPSDGYVETTEYNLISQRLTEIDRMQAEAVAAMEQRSDPQALRESSSRDQQKDQQEDAATARPLVRSAPPQQAPPAGAYSAADVRQEIATERAKIDAINLDIRQLQNQIQELRESATVRVSGTGAELRALPYIHATSLQVVKKGEQLTVLEKTQFWYRVRSVGGAEGWIYHGYVEER